MDKIIKAKSISIWIFIVPFIAVNTCLILITQFQELFPNQEDIVHNTFPYFDGMHRFLPALFRGFGYETVFINVNHRKRKFGICMKISLIEAIR